VEKEGGEDNQHEGGLQNEDRENFMNKNLRGDVPTARRLVTHGGGTRSLIKRPPQRRKYLLKKSGGEEYATLSKTGS